MNKPAHLDQEKLDSDTSKILEDFGSWLGKKERIFQPKPQRPAEVCADPGLDDNIEPLLQRLGVKRVRNIGYESQGCD
jgi:hypothetical protein